MKIVPDSEKGFSISGISQMAGERDPVQLARFRDRRCTTSTAEITGALAGHYQPEHVLTVKQAVALYGVHIEQLRW
jgi:hypothetical protein